MPINRGENLYIAHTLNLIYRRNSEPIPINGISKVTRSGIFSRVLIHSDIKCNPKGVGHVPRVQPIIQVSIGFALPFK